MAALSVEHLKVMAALTVEHANAFNLLLFFLTYLRGAPESLNLTSTSPLTHFGVKEEFVAKSIAK